MSDAKDQKTTPATPVVPYEQMESKYASDLKNSPIEALFMLTRQLGGNHEALILSALQKFESACSKLPDHESPEALLVAAADEIRNAVGAKAPAIDTTTSEQRARALAAVIHSAYRFPSPGNGPDSESGAVYNKAARVGVNVVAPVLLCTRTKTRPGFRYQLDRSRFYDSRATREVRSRIRSSPDAKLFSSDTAHFLDVHTSPDPLPKDATSRRAERLILKKADEFTNGPNGTPYQLLPNGSTQWTEFGMGRACVFFKALLTQKEVKKSPELNAMFTAAVEELCPSSDGKWTDVKAKPSSAAGRSIQSAAKEAARPVTSPGVYRVSPKTMGLLDFVRHSNVLDYERPSRQKSSTQLSFDAARHLEFSGDGSIDRIAQMISPDTGEWGYAKAHAQMERDAGVMVGVVDETSRPQSDVEDATPWDGVVWNSTLVKSARQHLEGMRQYLTNWTKFSEKKTDYEPSAEFEIWFTPAHGHRRGMKVDPFGSRPAAARAKWMELLDEMISTLKQVMSSEDNLVFKIEVEKKCPALNSFLGLFPCDSYFSNPLLANVHLWARDGKIKINSGAAKGQALRSLSHTMASRLLRHFAAVEVLTAFPALKGADVFDGIFYDQFLNSKTEFAADYENHVRIGVFSYRAPEMKNFRSVAKTFPSLRMRDVWQYAVRDMSLVLFAAAVCHRTTNYSAMLICQSYVDTLVESVTKGKPAPKTATAAAAVVSAEETGGAAAVFKRDLAAGAAMVANAARVTLQNSRLQAVVDGPRCIRVKDFLSGYAEQFRVAASDRKSVASSTPSETAWLVFRPLMNALVDIAARWCGVKYAIHELVTPDGVEWAIRLFLAVTQRIHTNLEQDLRKRWASVVARLGKAAKISSESFSDVRRARAQCIRGYYRSAAGTFKSLYSSAEDRDLVSQLLLDSTRNFWTAGIACEVDNEAESMRSIHEMVNTAQLNTVAALLTRSVVSNF